MQSMTERIRGETTSAQLHSGPAVAMSTSINKIMMPTTGKSPGAEGITRQRCAEDPRVQARYALPPEEISK